MFYTFGQNNSGGHFDSHMSDGITHFVIIEADNMEEACDIALDIGIYFNGVEKGIDCECCGDRWYRPWYDEGTETPKVYSQSPEEYVKDKSSHLWMEKGKEICVHYKDGRKEWF